MQSPEGLEDSPLLNKVHFNFSWLEKSFWKFVHQFIWCITIISLRIFLCHICGNKLAHYLLFQFNRNLRRRESAANLKETTKTTKRRAWFKFDKLLYKKIDYVSRSKLSSCVTKENLNIILLVYFLTHFGLLF